MRGPLPLNVQFFIYLFISFARLFFHRLKDKTYWAE